MGPSKPGCTLQSEIDESFGRPILAHFGHFDCQQVSAMNIFCSRITIYQTSVAPYLCTLAQYHTIQYDQ